MLEARSSTRKTITDILVDAGVVSRESVDEGLVRQQSTGRRIGETLVELGAATEEAIAWALAQQLSLVFVDLQIDALDHGLIHSFPETVLRRLQAVPLVRQDGYLSVAVADPTDHGLERELGPHAGDPIALCVATPTRITLALDTVFRPGSASSRTFDPRSGNVADLSVQNSLLRTCLAEAAAADADEVYLALRSDGVTQRVRRGGHWREAGSVPGGSVEAIVQQIERLGVAGAGHLRHSRGRIHGELDGRAVAADVSVLRTADEISVVLSLRPVFADPELEGLGLSGQQGASLRRLLASPCGVLLLVGPPASGRTTTLERLAAERMRGADRLLYFGTREGEAPSGATAVVGDAATLRTEWAEIAVRQAADVVVLDEILELDALAALFAPAAVGRLLIASVVGTSVRGALASLLRQPGLREPLTESLLGVLAQRRAAGPLAPGGGTRGVHFDLLESGPALWEGLPEKVSWAILQERADAKGLRAVPRAGEAAMGAESGGRRPLFAGEETAWPST